MKKYGKLLTIGLGLAVAALVIYALVNRLSRQERVLEFDPGVPNLYEAAEGASAAESSTAPDFTVYDEAGNACKLSDFRGKPVILNFWATWCGPCKDELPEIQAAWETYGEQIHFLIVDLADGRKDTVEAASAYLSEHGYTFPAYYDTDIDAADAYGVHAVPITYFIDDEGYFVTYQLGSMSEDILQQGIDLLLSD